jgi:hypothetical protein
MALGVTAYSEAPFGAEASDVIAYPLGIELTAQENSGIINIDVNVPVTGTPLVSTVGDAIGSAFVLVETTGQSLSSNLGTVTEVPIGQQVDVTGFDLTANESNPTHDTLTAFGEAPFATLSPATFNIPVEVVTTSGGIANSFLLSTSLGTISVAADANLTLTGQALTSNLGSVSITANSDASITGEAMTIADGTAVLDANTFATVSGEAMTAEEGIVDPSPDASVTGIGMSATIGVGTVVVGTADIDVTGELLTAGIGSLTVTADANTNISGELLSIAQGSVFAFADVDVAVTGQEMTMQENTPSITGDANVPLTALPMTANLGTAVLDANTLVDLTGQAMTMQEGTATADDASAEITGLSMSMSLGTVKNIMWSEVNTGTTQPWTEVDTAA